MDVSNKPHAPAVLRSTKELLVAT